VLRRAHREGADATDDAALLESIGATVRTVPGDPRNLKLTVPHDLVLAEILVGS
jgi:2-C-methyl-D-erythritol 4-phosphate cytidylyltransferase